MILVTHGFNVGLNPGKLKEEPITTPENLSRRVALFALKRIVTNRQTLDAALAQEQDFANLSARDRAFVYLLVKTALRRFGQHEALIAACMEKPLAAQADIIRLVLHLGMTQLLWLNTPPHAAVHSAVELSKSVRMHGFSGLINAVLKRIAREGAAMAAALDAERLNTPVWLWESWIAAYGEQDTCTLAQLHRSEPPLDITAKHDPTQWAEKLNGNLLPSGTIRLNDATSISTLPGFAEGAWWVQDEASADLVRTLARHVLLKDTHVLDLCAAPGGKTLQLAAAGAKVTALDLSENRMQRLHENLVRTGLLAECVVADAKKWKPAAPFSLIVLDAPCSATGTIRKDPEIALIRTPEDVARLVATQRALLDSALSMLQPGGMLAYGVCSLQPEEGPRQIAQLLEGRRDVTLIHEQPAVQHGKPRLYIALLRYDPTH